MTHRYDAVLFDLLSALLDSWTLWDRVAGDRQKGRAWRRRYLDITYATGGYQPYEELVRQAAEDVGFAPAMADELASRYGEIEPWPETNAVLGRLRDAGVPLAVVTNCSATLGAIAVGRIGVPFDVVVTAERAGAYKPDPRPYRLALEELGVKPERSLFVAGSAYDLLGTVKVGLPTWWHDRVGMTPPADAPAPIARHRDLTGLPSYVIA